MALGNPITESHFVDRFAQYINFGEFGVTYCAFGIEAKSSYNNGGSVVTRLFL